MTEARQVERGNPSSVWFTPIWAVRHVSSLKVANLPVVQLLSPVSTGIARQFSIRDIIKK